MNMKKYCLLCFVFLSVAAGLSAQSVGINTDGSAPDSSAILDLKSTDKGVLVPRMTAVQRSAISNPSKGLLVFQTDPVPAFCYYNGLVWINLTNGTAMNSAGYSGTYGYTSTFATNLGNVEGLATDSKGNIYVTEPNLHRILRVTPSGIVSVFAGEAGSSGHVNATGTAARFSGPRGIAIDAADNLFIAENGNFGVRKITPAGVVTTYAVFAAVFGIAIDPSGILYVSTSPPQNIIFKIDVNQTVTLWVGNGLGGFVNDTGLFAQFNGIRGMAVDAAGNIYVADYNNNCIRKIVVLANGEGVVTTFAGTGVPGNADGPAASATFDHPYSILIDNAGNIFVGDQMNNKIRKISPDGIVSTLAGNGLPGNIDGPDVSASFINIRGLAMDPFGNLYIGQTGNLRKITLY
jgi:hypothetical protein